MIRSILMKIRSNEKVLLIILIIFHVLHCWFKSTSPLKVVDADKTIWSTLINFERVMNPNSKKKFNFSYFNQMLKFLLSSSRES